MLNSLNRSINNWNVPGRFCITSLMNKVYITWKNVKSIRDGGSGPSTEPWGWWKIHAAHVKIFHLPRINFRRRQCRNFSPEQKSNSQADWIIRNAFKSSVNISTKRKTSNSHRTGMDEVLRGRLLVGNHKEYSQGHGSYKYIPIVFF